MTATLCEKSASFIDEAKIQEILEDARNYRSQRVRDALAKARKLKGLDAREMAALMQVDDPVLLEELFAIARAVKEEIYGNRLVLFAPLSIGSLCKNELNQKALSQDEIAVEVKSLIDQGHKRLLLVAGGSCPEKEGFDSILRVINTIYQTRSGRGEIRRVNVNIAPLTAEQFRELKAAKIGACQLFQETYHRETYAAVHPGATKRDFDWRLAAMDRAMKAGINDVGTGVRFGLYDWKFELLALHQHIRHLEEQFGVTPHTISVARIEPAAGSAMALRPPHVVSDPDFKKIVAILRLTLPYTGIILSTCENADTRRATFALGVSQISAGSRANPGGDTESLNGHDAEQFQPGDHRSLDEIVREVAALGYTPSFCTACYRPGRTGADFMDLAKPGLIKEHCGPNALSTCTEYLLDYASPETRRIGEALVNHNLKYLETPVRNIACGLVARVRANQRDVFV
ncbi:MAG TPA: [FeFe] hydrogenase H-cluster radical SAM maturase HydG [Verrucomicrobiae bacterium]|nr:[FeFe] hydrogenase H-cluster radical SAM maturase HydG [Verrucomicrobiae bacterium]